MVTAKRTNEQFLNFPRILWLDSKVRKSYNNILNSNFEIYYLNKIFGGQVA
jgi:hypothetical protein